MTFKQKIGVDIKPNCRYSYFRLLQPCTLNKETGYQHTTLCPAKPQYPIYNNALGCRNTECCIQCASSLTYMTYFLMFQWPVWLTGAHIIWSWLVLSCWLIAMLSLGSEVRSSLAPKRPKCNSILHLFGEWLFEAAQIGTELTKNGFSKYSQRDTELYTFYISCLNYST